jgi:membrane-bound lytic murein transglycosylase MltF
VAILKDSTNVSIFEQTPDAPLSAESTFEPGFDYTRALTQNSSDPQWCEGLVRYLDRLIRRSPNDLTPHIQRINALLAAGNKGDRVFAAAIDLHTVLGGNGLALQRRIHDQIFSVLDDQHRSDLVAIRSGALLPARDAEKHCSLPRSHAESLQLVEKKLKEPVKTFGQVDFDIGESIPNDQV